MHGLQRQSCAVPSGASAPCLVHTCGFTFHAEGCQNGELCHQPFINCRQVGTCKNVLTQSSLGLACGPKRERHGYGTMLRRQGPRLHGYVCCKHTSHGCVDQIRNNGEVHIIVSMDANSWLGSRGCQCRVGPGGALEASGHAGGDTLAVRAMPCTQGTPRLIEMRAVVTWPHSSTKPFDRTACTCRSSSKCPVSNKQYKSGSGIAAGI